MSLVSPFNRVLTEERGSAPAPVTSPNWELGESHSISSVESACPGPSQANGISISFVLAFTPAGRAARREKPARYSHKCWGPSRAPPGAVWPPGSRQYLLCWRCTLPSVKPLCAFRLLLCSWLHKGKYSSRKKC